MPSPIILVPGFWLGAWAWDEVVPLLEADGHEVTTLTLPGQTSNDEDRSSITFDDHVAAIVDAIKSKDEPVVLVVHSASGYSGYAASDVVPERIASMVYVDTAPGKPPLDPELEGDKAFVWEEIEAGENLDGLSEEQKARFRERAVSVPGGVARGTWEFRNDARRDVPSTLIATGFSSADYQKYAAENPEWSFLAGLPELRNSTWIDLPTSHWPMWSKPADLARIISDVATQAGEATSPR